MLRFSKNLQPVIILVVQGSDLACSASAVDISCKYMPMVMLSGTFMLATPQPSTPNIRDDGAPEKGGREPIAESFRGQGCSKGHSSLAPPVPAQPMAGYKSASYDKVPNDWSRPTTWPPRKPVPQTGPDAPHVVLSTKFQEPWLTISIGIKEILEELGCTVYNPNTDNKARSGATNNGLKAVL